MQAPYELPDDRSEIRITILDAVTRKELPWAVLEVHPLGLAAQKLQARYVQAKPSCRRLHVRIHAHVRTHAHVLPLADLWK
jgi:hypothetical protein